MRNTKTALKSYSAFVGAVHVLRRQAPRGMKAKMHVFRVVPVVNGPNLEYTLEPYGERAYVQTGPSELPAEIKTPTLTGLSALTSLAAKGEAWSHSDGDLWQAACAAAEELGLDESKSRHLSDAVTLALLCRRGAPDEEAV